MLLTGNFQEETHLALLFPFLRKCFLLNRKYSHEEGVAVIGIIVALFENMVGKLQDRDLQQILFFLVSELNYMHEAEDPPKKFHAMLFLALSISFAHNTGLVFKWLSDNHVTRQVFEWWFGFMDKFTQDFEFRPTIFGLCAIIKTPAAKMPDIIQENLPFIMNQLAQFTIKMHAKRINVFKANEEYVQVETQLSGAKDEDADPGEGGADPYAKSG